MPDEPLTVYGDSAYGTGALLDSFEQAGVQTRCKTQPPRAPGGRFPKSRFGIDLDAGTVTCPADHTVSATDDQARAGRPLRRALQRLPAGGEVHQQPVGTHDPSRPARAAARRRPRRQTDPAWRSDYTQTRPKVERKISHLMRRKHGGRRVRVRGSTKVAADFQLLAAAVNLARFAVLGLNREPTGWALSTS